MQLQNMYVNVHAHVPFYKYESLSNFLIGVSTAYLRSWVDQINPFEIRDSSKNENPEKDPEIHL